MEVKGIKYVGPIFDSSGYAQAARDYVLALHKLGVPIVIKPVSFEDTTPDLGEEGKILRELQRNFVDYNVVIIHTTPEFWGSHAEKDACNIGITVWETTRLHPSWSRYINDSVDAVIVPGVWNVEVFRDSGVTKPIYTLCHSISPGDYDNVAPYGVHGVDKNAYKFYSIFQFTERKHPMALIKSYWAAFQNNENVALIIKSYRNSFEAKERDIIKSSILKAKHVMPLDKYPPIYLVLDMLSREEVIGLHKFGDCLVSLDRGEGFGLTGFEASAMGNPIIVTGFGGALEYAKPAHSYLINYTLTPVFGMPWSPWYRGDQLWAEPDLEDAIDTLHYVYAHQEEAKQKALMAQSFIKDNFSHEKIALDMKSIIEKVIAGK